jgi:beta-lactam-binding protein with PASTA domain
MHRYIAGILKSRRFKKFLTGIAYCTVLFLVFDMVVMPWYVGHGNTEKVPSVLGLTLEAATAVLDSAGLEPVKAETRPDPKAAEGTVVGQNPFPDTIVKEGRRVYLSVSGGEILVYVPKLRGLSTRDARFALERAGLRLGEIAYTPSDTFFENTIVEQSVLPGGRVTKGSTVGITVSRGSLHKERVAPDVTGKTISEAERLLSAEKISVGKITYQAGFDLVPNTIVDQYPRPGEKIADGVAIDLFVVKLEDGTKKKQQPEH